MLVNERAMAMMVRPLVEQGGLSQEEAELYVTHAVRLVNITFAEFNRVMNELLASGTTVNVPQIGSLALQLIPIEADTHLTLLKEVLEQSGVTVKHEQPSNLH